MSFDKSSSQAPSSASGGNGSSERINSLLRAIEKNNADLAQSNRLFNNLQTSVNSLSSNVSAISTTSNSLLDYSYQKDLQFYSGKLNDDFEQWLELFELIASANEWEEQRKLKVLPAYLRGNALEQYRSLPHAAKLTYAALTANLKSKLKTPIGDKFKSAELHDRKQLPSETVADFYQVVKVLTRGAWPSFDDNTRDKLACDFFVNGLQMPLRRHVMKKQPPSLDEAKDFAEVAEAQNRLLSAETGAASNSAHKPELATFVNAVNELSENQRELAKLLNSPSRRVRFNSPEPSVAAVNNRLTPNPVSDAAANANLQAEVERLHRRLDGFFRNQKRDPRPVQTNRWPSSENLNRQGRSFNTGRPRCRNCGGAHHEYSCYRGRSRERSLSSGSGAGNRFAGAGTPNRFSGSGFGPNQRYRSKSPVPRPYSADYGRPNSGFPPDGYRNFSSSYGNGNGSGYKPANYGNRNGNPYANSVNGIQPPNLSETVDAVLDQYNRLQLNSGGSTIGCIRTTSIPVQLLPAKACSVSASLLRISVSFFLFICVYFAMLSSCEVYHICPQTDAGSLIHIPTKVTCIKPKPKSVRDEEIRLFVPRNTPITSVAYRCSLINRRICTNTGFFGSRGIVSDITAATSVSWSECEEAYINKTFRNQNLFAFSDFTFSTNNSLAVNYKWCCYDYCSEVGNFILETGQVVSLDGLHLSSTMGDLSGCLLNSTFCTKSEASYIWHPFNSSDFCPFVFKGTYTAKRAGLYFLIDKLQGAFTLTSKPYSGGFCSEVLYLTEEGLAVSVDDRFDMGSSAVSHFGSLLSSSVVTPWNMSNEYDPVNAKLVYLEHKLLDFERRDFSRVWKELCDNRQRLLHIVHELLRVDATLGVRAFLQRDDVSAKFSGQALIVWECHKTIPKTVLFNQTYKGICYVTPPVLLHNDDLWFLTPGSKDLSTVSASVPCSDLLLGTYFNGSAWVSGNSSVHVSVLSTELAWQHSWHPFIFRSPPIRDHNDLALSNIYMLNDYIKRSYVLEKQVHSLINYTSERSADPLVVYEILAGAGKGLGNAFEGYGRAVGFVLNSLESGVIHFANDLLKGPVQVIINLCVILTVLLCIICCLYFCIRHKGCRKKVASVVSSGKIGSYGVARLAAKYAPSGIKRGTDIKAGSDITQVPEETVEGLKPYQPNSVTPDQKSQSVTTLSFGGI